MAENTELIALLNHERLITRRNIIHSLRSQGWSRIDAENRADDCTDHYIVRIQELVNTPKEQPHVQSER